MARFGSVRASFRAARAPGECREIERMRGSNRHFMRRVRETSREDSFVRYPLLVWDPQMREMTPLYIMSVWDESWKLMEGYPLYLELVVK